MKRQRSGGGLGQRIRFVLTGTSVFWQHFILLAVMLALLASTLLIAGGRYAAVLRESYLDQAENGFHQNCESFASTLYQTYTVPTAVENSADYDNLLQAENGRLPATSKPIALAGLRNTFREILALLRMPADTTCFLYLRDGNAVCTRNRADTDAAACFAEYIRLGGMDSAETLRTLNSVQFSRLLPEREVMVGETEQTGVLLLACPTDSRTVMGMLCTTESILELFRINTLPQGTYFRLDGTDGENLLTYGEPGENCYEFTAAIRGVRCQATIGIPESYFSSLLKPTRTFEWILLGVTLLVGFLVCFLLSAMTTMPLRRLLSSYSLPEETATHRNEIRHLADLLASSRMESAEIHQILSSSVLVKVFSGGVLTEKEESKLLSAYPFVENPCRIAILHTTGTLEEFGQTAITELLQEHLPETFACGTVNNLETGLLLPDDEDSLHQLAQVLAGVNSQLSVDGLSLLCGVSATFAGVRSVYAAVRQARFSIPIRESSYIEVYSPEESGDERPGVFSWLTHERLYQAVMKNDRADTVDFIRALAADKYSTGDAKEVFYNVRFVVRSTAREMELPLPEADSLEYHEEMRPKENFKQLEMLVTTLFDRLHARQETNTNTTLRNLVAYIRENYRSADLSANQMATHFALPVKTVYAAVREHTGMNFNEYLVSVRMKEAAKLLCTTQKSVDEIAVLCGYPAQSTFYRVFGKYYGESPNHYRGLHGGSQK